MCDHTQCVSQWLAPPTLPAEKGGELSLGPRITQPELVSRLDLSWTDAWRMVPHTSCEVVAIDGW